MMDHYPGCKKRSCRLCGKSSLLSASLPFCPSCLRTGWDRVEGEVAKSHRRSRTPFGLPEGPPREGAVECPYCVNRCRIPEGGLGYCGAKTVKGGRLVHLFGRDRGLLSWYYDPLPTNCVAGFICPGCTGEGYPLYARSPSAEWGCRNLAVFFRSCTLNCLFCQNSIFKEPGRPCYVTPEGLADLVDETVTCICYFGGDPASQLLFSIRASTAALARRKGKPLRVCWETNGTENPQFMRRAGRLALESGGLIKIDWKASSRELHMALTGSPNDWVRENVRVLRELSFKRPSPPLLVVSTLLVPGYVDEEEVQGIARFLASIDPEIPYSLLAFHPTFLMGDLPTTSREHALSCVAAAEAAGLKRVHLGNVHLLN